MFKRNTNVIPIIINTIIGITFVFLGVTNITRSEGVFVGLGFVLIGLVTIVSHIYDIFSKKEVSQYQTNIEVTDSYEEKEKSF